LIIWTLLLFSYRDTKNSEKVALADLSSVVINPD